MLRLKAVFFAVILLAAIAFSGANAEAATFTVLNLGDSGADTLRQAITNANAAIGADTITFNVSGTITLASTLPTITDVAGLTMDGTGQTVTISGNNSVRVAIVDVGALLTLNNLTIANGSAAFLPFGTSYGGGIVNSGTLIITNSTFSGNSTPTGNSIYEPYSGGGIYNGGTLTITNSTFSGNSAAWGGGIYNGGTLTVTNSTFSGNSASRGAPTWQDGGGGIRNEGGAVTLRNTIIANSTGPGLNCGGAITDGGNNIEDGTNCGWGSTNGSMSSTNPLLGALANNGGPTQTFALLTGSPAINGVTFSSPNGAPATDQRGVPRPQNSAYDIGAYEEVPVCTPAPSGMVSWWKGENNALDLVGTNHGTLMNGATYAAGKVGQAFSFDGTDDYVDVGTNDVFNFSSGTGDFSIDAWIKLNAYPSQAAGIVGKATHGPGGPFNSPYTGWSILVQPSGALAFTGVGIWGFTTAAGAVALGDWAHVAVTRNGSTYKLYVNGSESASVTHNGNLETSTTALRIGTVYEDFSFLDGLMDEPEIFNRALSAEEIAAIYNAGSAGKCTQQQQYTLTVDGSGNGSGAVSATGIDCTITNGVSSGDCSDVYDDGTPVSLTPLANADSTFTGWSGDCDSNGQVTMDADKTCTATFTLNTYTLTVTKTGTGSGTVTSNPAGISCGSDCLETYNSSTAVTLTPAPDANSIFAGWSGDSDCSDGSVTMDEDKTCTATFEKVKFEESDPAITYTGTWNTYSCPSCSGGALKYSPFLAKAVFSFNGTGIKWIVTKANNLGKAKVYLDGVYMGLIDLYSAVPQYKVILQKTGLTLGAHSITLEVSGQKNLRSTGTYIDIDAFEVVP